MLHAQLGYPEVITNVKFANVTTMPLELRAGVERIESDITQSVQDGAYLCAAVDAFRRSVGLDEWRQHSVSQKRF